VNEPVAVTQWSLPLDDPYPAYEGLRREGPIHWLEYLNCHLVVAYEEAMPILRGPQWSSDAQSNPFFMERFAKLGGIPDVLGSSLLFSDPPDHTRLRKSLGSYLSPHAVAEFLPRIEAIVAAALGGHEPGAPLNVMEELAYAIPLAVMCELLNTGEDMAAVLRAETPQLVALLDPLADEATMEAGVSSALVLMLELVPLVAQRRQHPADDLVSRLAETRDEGLEVQEALGMTLLLLAAGHETTANLIGNAVIALTTQPKALQRLRRQPELIPSAVEELLRFDSPVQFAARFAKEDTTVAGQRVQAGGQVLIGLGAANRDPSVFAHPDRLDFERAKRSPLAFGHGAHFCAGASLARVEAQEVLRQLLLLNPPIEQRQLTYVRASSPTFRRLDRLVLG
jgi:cytochrome P450